MGESRKNSGRGASRASEAEGSRNGPKKSAVVVGIDNYLGTVNDLPSCINDARAVAALLQDRYGFSIRLLLDAEATTANVSDALTGALAGVSPQDRVVFYFSGHGSTALRGGRFEECLMLHDGAFFDEGLVASSRPVPAGVLTVVLDACFSGGVGKLLLAGQRSGGLVIDRARVKAFTRMTPGDFANHADQQENALVVKAFGRSFRPALPSLSLLSALGGTAGDAVGQSELNGMLVLACRDAELAATCTAQTKGCSAFTFALLETLSQAGPHVSASALIGAVQATLARMGFDQSPVLVPPPDAREDADKAFISLAPVLPSVLLPDGSLLSLNSSQEEPLMSFVNAIAAALVDQLRQQRDDQGVAGSLLAALSRNSQGQRQGNLNDAIVAQAMVNALANGANRNGQYGNQNDAILAQAVANALANSGSRNTLQTCLADAILAQAVANAANRNQQNGQNELLAQVLANALNRNNAQQGQGDILAQAMGNALANAVSRNAQQGAQSDAALAAVG
ncbi:MAG: caspase family protein [Magnetospirillum sp.]|nr:caspase family protein [Magnetospirillum sp.]